MLKKYPNDKPQMMLVAEPVLLEVDSELIKNGCVV